MRKSDPNSSNCGTGYRRIELESQPGVTGEFRCLSCNEVLDVLDGTRAVVMRLTVQPKSTRRKRQRST